jgi:hypothetical protein
MSKLGISLPNLSTSVPFLEDWVGEIVLHHLLTRQVCLYKMSFMCTLPLAIQSSFAFCGFVLRSFANFWGHTKNKMHCLDPLLYRRMKTVQQLEQALKQ